MHEHESAPGESHPLNLVNRLRESAGQRRRWELTRSDSRRPSHMPGFSNSQRHLREGSGHGSVQKNIRNRKMADRREELRRLKEEREKAREAKEKLKEEALRLSAQIAVIEQFNRRLLALIARCEADYEEYVGRRLDDDDS